MIQNFIKNSGEKFIVAHGYSLDIYKVSGPFLYSKLYVYYIDKIKGSDTMLYIAGKNHAKSRQTR